MGNSFLAGSYETYPQPLVSVTLGEKEVYENHNHKKKKLELDSSWNDLHSHGLEDQISHFPPFLPEPLNVKPKIKSF